MAFGYDGSVRIKADLNHSNFDRGLAYMTRQVNTFGNTLKKIGGLVAMAFGTAALVNFAKESVKLASDIQEVQNVIDVTFGKGAAQIEEFAQAAVEAYGLSELAAKQYTGTMGAMLKSSGLATSAAQEMSMALTGLAGDVASFYNLDTDTAFEKIRSGISGETEPLKQLGINMSVANLEAYALSKGITKSYNAMSQAEQVLLRYNYLLSVTTDAQGDFARTSGSFANQIRILQLNFDQLRIAVGNALIPIAQAVLPSINAIIAGLTKLAKVFAQVTALLFGKSPEVKTTSGIAASAGAAADATDKLAESTAGAGSAAKQAEKDMKGVLASFDDLNVLANRASDSVGNAGGGLGGVGSDFDIPGFEAEIDGELFGDTEISPKLLKEIEELKDDLSRIWEVFKKSWEINGPGVVEAAKRALSSIYGLLKSIGTAFTEAWTGGTGLDFLNAVFALLETVLNIIADIADAWKTAFDDEGASFFESILSRLTAMLELINSIGVAFREVWNNGTGVEICETILRILTDINNIFGTIYTKIREAWEVNGNGVAIWQAILDVVQTVLNFVERLTSATLEWAQGLNLEPLVTAFRNLLEAINPLVKVITDGLAYAYENVLLPFGKWFLEELAPVGIELVAAAIEAFTNVLETIQPVAEWFWENFLQPLAKWAGDMLLDDLKTATNILNDFSAWVSENQNLVQDIALILMSFATAWGLVTAAVTVWNTVSAIATAATTAFGAAIAFLTSPIGIVTVAIGAVIAIVALLAKHWDEVKEAAGAAWDWIVEKWNAAGEWFNTNVIQPISEFFGGLWENITQWASETWDNICDYWSGVATWWDENVIQPVAKAWDKFWGDLSQWASDTWDAIVAVWESVSNWFNETVIEPVSKFFTDLWDGIKQAASDLWDAIVSVWESAGKWFEDHVTKPIGAAFEAVGNFIKNVLNGVIGGIEWLINKVIDGVNWLISQLNKLSIDVPEGVPIFGGTKFGFNIQSLNPVSLPRLANGAVIPPNQQFAAILGDQRSGRNLEGPEAVFRQGVRDELSAFFGRGGGIGRSGDMTIIMEIDGREFGRASYRYGTAEQQRVGVRLAEVRS